MKTENAAGYLYDFYRKERRGLVQASIEERGGVLTGFCPVGTSSDQSSWHRWAALEVLEAWE